VEEAHLPIVALHLVAAELVVAKVVTAAIPLVVLVVLLVSLAEMEPPVGGWASPKAAVPAALVGFGEMVQLPDAPVAVVVGSSPVSAVQAAIHPFSGSPPRPVVLLVTRVPTVAVNLVVAVVAGAHLAAAEPALAVQAGLQ
jgi:hypothetical protein